MLDSTRLFHVPELRTARLRLRAFEESDAPAYYSCYSSPEVIRYMDWGGPSSVMDALHEQKQQYDDVLLLAKFNPRRLEIL